MRVLVTGAGGFVGRHLVDHLRDCGDDVTAWNAGEVEITDHADVTRAVRLDPSRPFEAVYHLAAQSRVDLSWEDPASTMTINASGTLNLLDALGRDHNVDRSADGAPRVLVMSSAEVYGIVDGADLPIEESRPLAPRSPYGVSKAAAEQAAWVFGQGRGIEVVVCRPFNLIGPGQQPEFVAAGFARRIVANERKGETRLQVGNLAATRDFVDVRDAARALRAVMVHGADGEAYNICRGEEVSIRALLDALVEASPTRHEVVVDEGRFRPNDLPRMAGSNDKIRHAAGWTPERPLAESLADLLAEQRRQAHDEEAR